VCEEKEEKRIGQRESERRRKRGREGAGAGSLEM